MKLYTEEQVLKFINDNFDEGCSQLIGLTPIELPSDEEIETRSAQKAMIENSLIQSLCMHYFNLGAVWMRDKIGGNK